MRTLALSQFRPAKLLAICLTLCMTLTLANAAIQYNDFGGSPITLNFSNPQYIVPGAPLSLRFIYGTSGLDRSGSLIYGFGNNMPVVSSGAQVTTLSSGSTISDTNNYNTLSYLWYRSDTLGFNPDLLQPSDTYTIGFRIPDGADYYYGWATLGNIQPDGSSYQLLGFAYNDAPNAPIEAEQQTDPPSSSAVPEPSSLGLIFLGAAGLAFLRRQHSH